MFCVESNILRSTGRTRICDDNAVAESFFATYKKEQIHTKLWPKLTRLRRETFLWTEDYYNTCRRHSYLGYLTPNEYKPVIGP